MILVICHGNVNRSALAEAILRKRGFVAVSAGIKDGPFGQRAAAKSRRWAAAHGYDLEAHRARSATWEWVAKAQKIYLFDNGNLRRFTEQFPQHLDKVEVLGIPDPGFIKEADPRYNEIMQRVLDFFERLEK